MKKFLILFVVIFVGCASARDREVSLDFIPPSERLQKAVNEGVWSGRGAEDIDIPFSAIHLKMGDVGDTTGDIFWVQDFYGRQKWGPFAKEGLTRTGRFLNSAGGVMNGISTMAAAGIGGLLFKEGMEGRNPDQTNVNASGGPSSSVSSAEIKP